MSDQPHRSWKRTAALWLGRTGIVLAFVALTPVIAGAAILSPYLVDDVALDHTVRAVALDWRDFGKEQAQARLDYELDHQGIGLQVGDTDCRLSEEGEARVVSCAWSTAMTVPGLEEPIRVPFRSSASLNPLGELR